MTRLGQAEIRGTIAVVKRADGAGAGGKPYCATIGVNVMVKLRYLGMMESFLRPTSAHDNRVTGGLQGSGARRGDKLRREWEEADGNKGAILSAVSRNDSHVVGEERRRDIKEGCSSLARTGPR